MNFLEIGFSIDLESLYPFEVLTPVLGGRRKIIFFFPLASLGDIIIGYLTPSCLIFYYCYFGSKGGFFILVFLLFYLLFLLDELRFYY